MNRLGFGVSLQALQSVMIFDCLALRIAQLRYATASLICLMVLCCYPAQAVQVGVDSWITEISFGNNGFFNFAIDPDKTDPAIPPNLYLAANSVLSRRVNGAWSNVATNFAPTGILANVDSTYYYRGRVMASGLASQDFHYYGVHSSLNSGLTWLAEIPNGMYISSQRISEFSAKSAAPFSYVTDSKAIYASDYLGAIKSIDGGVSWKRIYTNAVTGYYDLTIHDGSIFLFIDTLKIVRSDDGGLTWINITAPTWLLKYSRNQFTSIGKTLYLSSPTGGPIYKTTNKGTTWTTLPYLDSTPIRYADHIIAIGDVLLASNSPFALSSPGKIFYTFDEGVTWQTLPDLPTYISLQQMMVVGSTLYVGLSMRTTGGIFSITPKLAPVTPPEKNLGKCPCMNPPMVGGASGTSSVAADGASSGGEINAATGNLFQTDVDYAGAAATRLAMVRNYNSLAQTSSGGARAAGLFGSNWWTRYDSRIDSPASVVKEVIRGDGRVETFINILTTWVPDADVTSKLLPQIDGSWIVVSADDSKDYFDGLGRITRSVTRDGQTTTMTYDVVNRLSTITGPFGHKLTLNYDTSNRVNKVIEPDNTHFTAYSYDANNNLSTVTYQDNKVRTYLYENIAYPHALTGVVDENLQHTALYGYDMQGRAILSQGAAATNKTQVAYRSATQTDVTTATGAIRTYNLATTLKVPKPTTITGDPCPDCGGVKFTYDSNGFINSMIDANGNITNYSHDTRGLETVRSERNTNGFSRDISTTWDTTYHVPLTIAQTNPYPFPAYNRITTMTYDTSGNVLTRAVTDTTSLPKIRKWTYSYNSLGQLLTVDGPRTDVADITTYSYYPNNSVDPYGMVQSVTNALGHVTQYRNYDANGRPQTVIDPNGTVTTLTYDARGRMQTRTVGGLVTAYSYDAGGRVTRMTQPDSSYVSFVYDAAGRVKQVADNLGQRIDYTLDDTGNMVAEIVRDAAGVAVQTRTASYDKLNRLAVSMGAAGQTTQYSYDNNSNLLTVTDGLNQLSRQSYDGYNRQVGAIDPLLGQAQYVYDNYDNLTSVTDPRGLVTSYYYDGVGNRRYRVSPDTGNTSYVHDDAGNMKQATDMAGRVQNYSYDALNRVTLQKATWSGHTAVADIVLGYDSGTGGTGRLTSMVDASGSTGWLYDSLGRVTNKTVNTVGTVALSVGYSYDSVGHLASMTYPSGKVVSYGYDTNGRVQSVSLDGTSLISNINYQPFGAPKSWVWSNGTAYSRSFDMDGRLSAYALSPTRQRSVLFDAGNRVTGYSDTVASRSQSFSYDANDRMIGWSNSTVAEAFTYDANSNRLSYATTGKTLAQTTYPTTNNRFIAVTGGAVNLTPTYDATGNITYMYNVTYNYDARNRMASSVNGGITTNYWINGLGQRARKTYNAATPSSLTFVYDEARRHIGTYNLAGVPSEETIYLGDTPIAVLMGTDINYNYVYADQTNTPRVITNTAGQQRWTWDNTAPFGQTVPNLNPSGLGDFVYRHGMPGQVYDAESGAYNNGFRDYYPLIGRYLQSDPIGLAGGDFSTYGYVGQAPNMGSDMLGLTINVVGSGQFVADYNMAINYLKGSSLFQRIFDVLSNSPNIYNVNPLPVGADSNNYRGNRDQNGNVIPNENGELIAGDIGWASRESLLCLDFSAQTAALGLAHELGHAYRAETGASDWSDFDNSLYGKLKRDFWQRPEEVGNIRQIEANIAIQLGEPVRDTHSSWTYYPSVSPTSTTHIPWVQ